MTATIKAKGCVLPGLHAIISSAIAHEMLMDFFGLNAKQKIVWQ